jgi:hypothetical protein
MAWRMQQQQHQRQQHQQQQRRKQQGEARHAPVACATAAGRASHVCMPRGEPATCARVASQPCACSPGAARPGQAGAQVPQGRLRVGRAAGTAPARPVLLESTVYDSQHGAASRRSSSACCAAGPAPLLRTGCSCSTARLLPREEAEGASMLHRPAMTRTASKWSASRQAAGEQAGRSQAEAAAAAAADGGSTSTSSTSSTITSSTITSSISTSRLQQQQNAAASECSSSSSSTQQPTPHGLTARRVRRPRHYSH